MLRNDIVVLGLLKERPMHGYQIKHQIEERHLDRWVHVSLPSIYNTLNRLENKELIGSRREKVGKMPERIIYHITPKGETAFSRLVERALVNGKLPESTFWLGVAFLQGLERRKVEKCLLTRLKLLRNQLVHMRADLQLLDDERQHHLVCLLRSGASHIKLEVEYLEDLLKHLKKGK